MRMTANVTRLLLAIHWDQKELAALYATRPEPTGNYAATKRWRIQRATFREAGVPYDLSSWLRRSPTPAERATYSRTLKIMEREGLLIRASAFSDDPDRASRIRLTESGEAFARRISGTTATTEANGA